MSPKVRTASSIVALLLTSAVAAQTGTPPSPAGMPTAQTAPQPVQQAHPALWMIKDADTTVYLFGTIHVLPPGLRWFDGPIKSAFDRSDTLVLETVRGSGDGSLDKSRLLAGIDPSQTPLSQQLPADYAAKYQKAMTARGLPPKAYDHFRPWLAALIMMLPANKADISANMRSGADNVLSAAAQSSGKPIVGLDSQQDLLSAYQSLGTLGNQDGIELVKYAIDNPAALADRSNDMYQSWAMGDVREDAQFAQFPEVRKALLVDRNAHWAAWIEQRMKTPGTVFVAVGAGHLAGSDSVQGQLAKSGVKAVRVTY